MAHSQLNITKALQMSFVFNYPCLKKRFLDIIIGVLRFFYIICIFVVQIQSKFNLFFNILELMGMTLFHQSTAETFCIHGLTDLDATAQHRLRDLGLTTGKQVKIVRRYPFNGPIILSFDDQKVGLRKALVRRLRGGD